MFNLSGLFYRLFLLLFISLISINAYALSHDKLKVVKTVGTAAIVKDDTSKAKDQAISMGFITAIEAVLNEMLPQEIVVANFKTITDILYNYTDNFIDDYKILAETKYDGNYRVMVKTSVSTKKIFDRLNDAGIVLDPKNRHKILFLIFENNLQDIAPQFWWGKGMAYIKTISDSTITQAMQKKGFDVLSHRLVNRTSISNEIDAPPFNENLSAEDIISLGKYFNADIVVSGSASASHAQNTMGENKSFKGEMHLDIFRVDTGEKLDSVSSNSVTVNVEESIGSNDALIKVALEAADKIASKINIAMKKEINKPGMIEVVVEGINFFRNYSRLTKKIKLLPEVKKITQREKRPDRAIIVIEYSGNGKNFAKKIMGQTFSDFGLSISEVTRNHVRLEMIPPGSHLFSR